MTEVIAAVWEKKHGVVIERLKTGKGRWVRDPEVIAELTPAAVADLGLQVGPTVWLSVKATDVSAYRR
jgi:molybdopterin-binding protein